MLESSGDLIHCDWHLYKERGPWNEHTWGEYQMNIEQNHKPSELLETRGGLELMPSQVTWLC